MQMSLASPAKLSPGALASPLRLNVYIDGFNFYYGCLKYEHPDCKWLDFGKFCQIAIPLPNYQVNRIRYFTAPVKGAPAKHARQQVLLRALHTIPNLTVHRGHFLRHEKEAYLVGTCPAGQPPPCNPHPSGPHMAYVYHTEEKGSDVNLATYLLFDGFKRDYDAAVVISNDSDLVEPIRIVQDELGLPVGILNPQIGKDRHGQPKKPSNELRQTAKLFFAPVWGPSLKQSQFPTVFQSPDGRPIQKPSTW